MARYLDGLGGPSYKKFLTALFNRVVQPRGTVWNAFNAGFVARGSRLQGLLGHRDGGNSQQSQQGRRDRWAFHRGSTPFFEVTSASRQCILPASNPQFLGRRRPRNSTDRRYTDHRATTGSGGGPIPRGWKSACKRGRPRGLLPANGLAGGKNPLGHCRGGVEELSFNTVVRGLPAVESKRSRLPASCFVSPDA